MKLSIQGLNPSRVLHFYHGLKGGVCVCLVPLKLVLSKVSQDERPIKELHQVKQMSKL